MVVTSYVLDIAHVRMSPAIAALRAGIAANSMLTYQLVYVPTALQLQSTSGKIGPMCFPRMPVANGEL
jgi:hypothetical protein